MIPTPIEELTEVLPTVTDIKYKKMLEEQLTFLNNHKAELFKKINYFQNLYRKNHMPQRILERSCNFILLEELFKNMLKHNSNFKTLQKVVFLFYKNLA